MTSPDPFWRAVILTLAFWLVGLGIETGPDTRPRQAPASQSGQFASERTVSRQGAPSNSELPSSPTR